MYPKKYLLITLASTIIIGLIYRFYNNKKKKDIDKKLLKNDQDQQTLILEADQKNEESEDESELEELTISEYSNDSIDSEYYPNWNNLLSELIKNGKKVFDTHVCKVDKKNYVPVLDMRNHLNRFWIPK